VIERIPELAQEVELLVLWKLANGGGEFGARHARTLPRAAAFAAHPASDGPPRIAADPREGDDLAERNHRESGSIEIWDTTG